MLVDLSLDNKNIYKTSDADLILQQIDLLFDTYHNEVLGEEDFGTEYDRYLYDLKISNAGIKNQVLTDLMSLDLLGYIPDVEVHLLQGTEQDICLINIILTKDNNKIEKIYKITQ